MKPAQILHLTDLHLKPSGDWNQKLLQSKLLEDLGSLRTRGHQPQLVIFSGDLAQAATGNSYGPVVDYIQSVLQAVGLTTDELILCPGNHDISRSVVGPRLPELNKWRNTVNDNDGSERLAQDPVFVDYLNEAFENYLIGTFDLRTKTALYSDNFSSGYYFEELDLYVAVTNTASLSSAGLLGESDDRAKLFIPESSIISALRGAPASSRKIVVGHHPMSWLNDSNNLLMSRAIPNEASAYFCGHLHEATPAQSATMNGDLLTAQSGALYAHRKYWNGYAVVTFREASDDARLIFRRWFEPRRAFAKAEDLGDDGIFYSSASAKDHWLAARAPESEPLESWRKTHLLPEIISECNTSLSDQELDLVFVEPEFEHEVPYGKEADGRVGSRLEVLSFDEVVQSDTNYVISASSETGKSTLLKQIALHYARREAVGSDWIFPVIIQFEGIRPISGKIEKMVRDKLPDLPGSLKIRDLLQSGSVILLVDDVDFAEKKKRDALLSFVTQYPSCRYVFTSGTPFVESAALKPEITKDVPFTRIRMKAIKAEQMLTLIENHGLTDPLEADQMLARVLRDSSALNVPLTPVTGTFLIQIFQDDPDHVMLNQAALTERYVEILLQKYAPRDLLPGTFDFRNKVDLLSTITDFMVRTGEYAPEYNTVLSWVVEYLNRFGLKFSASNLLKYFIDARVFEHHGTTVSFRLRMFFEFFAATRMIEHRDFRDYILDKSRYLSFINEISFYSALNRKDHELIATIDDAFKALSSTSFDANKIGDPEQFFKDFKVPGQSTTEEELDEIYSAVKDKEELTLDRQRLTDGDFSLLATNANQAVERIRYETPSEQWFAHLVLLSTLVKHMELIPNDDKRAHLASALDGWVQFTANSLGIVNALAKERRVAFNGITYISTLADDLPMGEVARRLSLTMPAAIGRMAGTFIATDKLYSQLAEGIGSQDDPLARQLMRFSIISDMGSASVAQLADKAADSFKGHRFLSHALARKLHEVAVRFRLPKEVLSEVRNAAADLFVALENVPGGKVAGRRSTLIESMANQRRQISAKTTNIAAIAPPKDNPKPSRPRKAHSYRRPKRRH